MRNKVTFIKISSNLFQNLGAGWLGLVLLGPTFSNVKDIHTILVLTLDLVFGIVFLITAFFIERQIYDI